MGRASASVKAGIIFVASALVAIVGADVLLRLAGYMPQVDVEWLVGPKAKSRVPDDRLILIHPRLLKEEHYAVDPDLDIVVALGDSFVEGHPVKKPLAYPAVLRGLLDALGRPANVIAAGLGDSGPDQQLRLFKEQVLPRVTPDAVVWSFYANDLLDNLRQPAYEIDDGSLAPLDASKHWLHIRHRAYLGVPLPNAVKSSSPVIRLAMRAHETWSKRDLRLDDPAAIEMSKRKILLAIDAMDDLATKHGFDVFYVLIAPQALYLREQDPETWDNHYHVFGYRSLRPLLSRQAGFVDAWFGDADYRACDSRITVPPLSDLFANDGRDKNPVGTRHFNETGYYLLADVVATCLSAGNTE